MSIIVAVRKEGRVVVASDSQSRLGDERHDPRNLRVEKTMRLGAEVIGCAGWMTHQTLLEDYIEDLKEKPAFGSNRDVYRFFLGYWSSIVADGVVVNQQSDETGTPFANLDSMFLVATPSTIYRVAGDFRVVQFERYCAVGSGDQYAYGALCLAYDTMPKAEDVATAAVRAAIEMDTLCGGEVQVLEVNGA